MSLRLGRGHVGISIQLVPLDGTRYLRTQHKSHFYVGRVHRQCLFTTFGQVVLVYLQWGSGL